MSAPNYNMAKTERRRRKAKNRTTSAPFLMIPTEVLRSTQFGALGAWSVKLLVELGMQYRGYNNGDFSATYKMLKARGWNSSGTLTAALKRLEAAKFVLKTRQGGKNLCNLYAITWWPIDECDGKIDYKAESVAGHDWKLKSNPHGEQA